MLFRSGWIPSFMLLPLFCSGCSPVHKLLTTQPYDFITRICRNQVRRTQNPRPAAHKTRPKTTAAVSLKIFTLPVRALSHSDFCPQDRDERLYSQSLCLQAVCRPHPPDHHRFPARARLSSGDVPERAQRYTDKNRARLPRRRAPKAARAP